MSSLQKSRFKAPQELDSNQNLSYNKTYNIGDHYYNKNVGHSAWTQYESTHQALWYIWVTDTCAIWSSFLSQCFPFDVLWCARKSSDGIVIWGPYSSTLFKVIKGLCSGCDPLYVRSICDNDFRSVTDYRSPNCLFEVRGDCLHSLFHLFTIFQRFWATSTAFTLVRVEHDW